MSAEQITPVSGPYKGKTGTLSRRYSDGSASVQFPGVIGVWDIRAEDMPPTFDAYAWPGGYPIAYYTDGGDVLCPDCARKDYEDDGTIAEAGIEAEAHSDIHCDQCSQVIAYQNWCDFCQDSVDVDEDHPHVCKPLKWAVQYRYQNTGLPPSIQRYATREQARSMARYYRNRGYQMVNVYQLFPPIMPEQR